MESTTLNPATYFLASKNQIYERITLQKHHLGSFVAFLEKKKKKKFPLFHNRQSQSITIPSPQHTNFISPVNILTPIKNAVKMR
jgi:hypothetical protein